jgi:hypothetical protein
MKSNVITIDQDEIVVRVSAEHDFLLNSQEVAFGYGVSSEVIRSHKANHSDELTEGKHWVTVENINGGAPITLWTKRGIIRLGFFIRSERAKKFRDAAEDLILGVTEKPAQSLNAAADPLVSRVLLLVDELLGRGVCAEKAAYTASRVFDGGEASHGKRANFPAGRPPSASMGEMLALIQGRELTRTEWVEAAINAGLNRTQSYNFVNQAIADGVVGLRSAGGKILFTAKQEASR